MSRLILQPSGDKVAQKHYEETIKQPVSLDRLQPFLNTDQFEKLKNLYPNELCYVWGVTPASSNKSKWDKIERGDVAVFSKEGKIFSSSVVTYKIHNEALAVELWDRNDKDQTWEYIYFLDEIHNVNIPYIDFNQSVLKKNGEPYADNFVIQGFGILDYDQCYKFFEKFDLQSDIIVEEIDEKNIDKILQDLSELEDTDAEIISKKRLEQAYLKKLLFGSNTDGTCACCGKIYPVSYLVTAHIKKRSFCEFKERKDKNIVFPMCKLGCDEIFERGYVSVENGQFINLDKIPTTASLFTYIQSVVGNNCSYYSNETASYFKWHKDFHTGK